VDDIFPPWLKAMQNGSIGEARTRAFLLDRFWVLERSADIDGADFIIQRRLTSQNLLDRNPPRFGVVQAKFFAGPDTTHFVPKPYLVDKDNQIRKEFFLLCHNGTADKARSFLLTADDLVKDFDTEETGKVKIPGRILLNEPKFEVKAHDLALDRMERTLSLAEFTNNRAFLSWFIPHVEFDPSNIDPTYQEPIDNWWGDIPPAFAEMRRTAQKAIYCLDEARDPLQEIVKSSDPEYALSLAEQFFASHGSRDNVSVALPNDLYDQDFHTVVLQHKKRVTTLRDAGLLDAFVLLKKQMFEQVVGDLAPKLPLNKNTVQQITIRYDPKDFSGVQTISSFVPAEQFARKPAEIDRWGLVPLDLHVWSQEAEPGRIIYCWTPGRYAFQDKETNEDWLSYFRDKGFTPIANIMDIIYVQRFGG
jgi:hypothetical protein